MSSARAATAEMSLSTIGAVEAAAYGPATTSPARICAAHMPAKFVAKTVGRRLTQASPESTASCSTSLLRSPRTRDGCRAKSSSALIADSATSLVTPGGHRLGHHTLQIGQVFAQRAGIEEHRRSARQRVGRPSQTTSTRREIRRCPVCGLPLARGRLRRQVRRRSGRPTLPVAPVTTIVMGDSFVGNVRSTKDGMQGGKVTVGTA